MDHIKRLHNLLSGKKDESVKHSGYTYKPPGRPSRKRKKWLYIIGSLVLLSAVVVGILSRLPFSFQDAGRMIKLSVGRLTEAEQEEIAGNSTDARQVRQNNPVLRGTIYDRNMEEMSVSYQLFSLFVRPAEVSDRQEVAEKLALILGRDKKSILRHLRSMENVIELADDLEAVQVGELERLRQPGIYCVPAEVRYFPGHAVAGHLLGFMNEHVGLSGVEALYDSILQPGEFRHSNVPSIDFSGYDALGKTSTDVILTVDMELQKLLDQELDAYRMRKGAVSASALAMDPDTGRVLAMVSQPGFDPNYFWRADEQKESNTLFSPLFIRDLVRPMLVEAAAIYEAGADRNVLPVTVSVPDYGLTEDRLAEYQQQFGLERSVSYFLPVSLGQAMSSLEIIGKSGRLSTVQIGVGMATLLNSGHRVKPWLLNALYDHAEKRFFMHDAASNLRERLVSPAGGVNLRRKLLRDARYSGEDGFLFVNSGSALSNRNGMTVHHIQELLLAAAPKERPKVLLIFSINYGALYPEPPGPDSARSKEGLAEIGQRLLPILADYGETAERMTEAPLEKSAVNKRQYFFSRRLNTSDLKKKYEHAQPTMPQLIGLSLRKGLQQINLYNLKVRIRGSGRIVRQKPTAGEPLTATETCELTLEPFL
jgi:cell division protein FtsI (penicillin-binding protein 3)